MISLTPESMLSFDNQAIKMNTAEEAEEVAKKIEAFKNMTVLELKGNTIGVQAGERIAEALRLHPELQRCLWSDMFTGRLKTEIPPILRSMCGAMIQTGCRITELDLSDNAFGPIGAEGISEFLVSASAYSLQTLKLNNNGLGAGGKIVAKCLIQCYENALAEGQRFALKTFVAGRNRLENPGAMALAEAFKMIGTLEQISIPQNGIRAEGICALADAIEENKKLTVLNLNDNTCTPIGAMALARAVTDLTLLKTVDLGDCLCRDTGVLSIISVLCDGRHHDLQYVDFSGSELSGSVGCEVVETFLMSYENMDTKLKLANNCFGSSFDDVAELAYGSNIYIGEEEDDEGSLSERESSGSESDDEESEPAKVPVVPQANEVSALESLLKAASVNEKPAAPLFSFSDKGNVPIKMQPPFTSTTENLLSFENQQIKMNSSEEAEEVAQKIEAFKNMTALELKGNTIGVEAGGRIAEALRVHPELKRCLWSDMFTGRLKTEIPPILRSLCSAMMQAGCRITELDLSDNAFGPIGAEGISDFLVSSSAFSLQTLKLNNNGLGAGGKIIAKCLIQCYQNAQSQNQKFALKTFIAGRNRLENPGAMALAEAFKMIGTLEHISIPQNGIRPEGICALAGAVKENKNLSVLNFNDNTCTPKGAMELATAISDLTALKTVDLGDCLCRDTGVVSIMSVLCDGKHTEIEYVDFSGSELGGPVACDIIKSFRTSFGAKNTELRLSNNCFGTSFDNVASLAYGSNIFVGDEDDDEGSLSERESDGSESDDEESESVPAPEVRIETQKPFSDVLRKIEAEIQNISEEFLSASQEAASRLILQLAVLLEKSAGDPSVLEEIVKVSDDVMYRVKCVKRRPIPSTTQVVNNIVAQMGLNIKPEENWGIKPRKEYMLVLLDRLLAIGHFTDEKPAIDYYFRQM